MHSSDATSKLLIRLWGHISPGKRRQFSILVVSVVLGACIEILSISSVLPFLMALTDADAIFRYAGIQPYLQLLNINAPEQLLLPLTLVFGICSLASGVVRLFIHWATSRLAFSVAAELGLNLYQRTLYQPYEVHISRNSSEVINIISNKVDTSIHHTLLPILAMISQGTMLVLMFMFMLTVDAAITLAAFVGFGFSYILIFYFNKTRLLKNSLLIAQESAQVIKVVQEGLGGIRDVLIDGSQAIHAEAFHHANDPLRRAQANSVFISVFPRYAMEAIGMCLIAMLAYTMTQNPKGLTSIIPLLGLFGLTAQRLLPILQQLYAAWVNLQVGRHSLQDVLEMLDQALPTPESNPPCSAGIFTREIAVKQLSFQYAPTTPWVLKNIDLIIAKGERIGFIGKTGSGKSTLLDIIMSLLPPTTGAIEIDGQAIEAGNRRAWQTHIAHVPQAIFLADTSVTENIAFGQARHEIDHDRVQKAAQQAQIADVIEAWPKRYQTLLGERGVKLSGGQRQRIGIARALYKQADVLILDEATSALDNETEQTVMETIETLDKDITILVIAHRLSTLKSCDRIYELTDSEIRLKSIPR